MGMAQGLLPGGQACSGERIATQRATGEGPPCARAFTLYTYELEWAEAQEHFDRALELKPESAVAHHWYAWFLLQYKGRENLKKAEIHIEEAPQLAPLDPIILCNMGKIEYYGREHEASVSKYKKALEMHPHYLKTHLDLGLAYAELKELDKAKEEFAKVGQRPRQRQPGPDRRTGLRVCEEWPTRRCATSSSTSSCCWPKRSRLLTRLPPSTPP